MSTSAALASAAGVKTPAAGLGELDAARRGGLQPPRPEAYHELPGAIVEAVAPHTEADPSAILTQLLVACGAQIGRGAFFQVEATVHHPNQFCLLVGDSSKARKGSSLDCALAIMRQAIPDLHARIAAGLSSGEGLVWSVRDPQGQDPGAPDRRLLVIEPEFASVSKACSREASTLSPTLRCAWDGRPLQLLTRTSPARATDAHIAIIGHITAQELRRHASSIEIANGLLNRFVLCACRRVRLLPEGGQLDNLQRTGLRACSPPHSNRQPPPDASSSTPPHASCGGRCTRACPPLPTASPGSSPPAPKRTRSASHSSTRYSTANAQSTNSTSRPRSRYGATPALGPLGARPSHRRPARRTALHRARSPPRRTDPHPAARPLQHNLPAERIEQALSRWRHRPRQPAHVHRRATRRALDRRTPAGRLTTLPPPGPRCHTAPDGAGCHRAQRGEGSEATLTAPPPAPPPTRVRGGSNNTRRHPSTPTSFVTSCPSLIPNHSDAGMPKLRDAQHRAANVNAAVDPRSSQGRSSIATSSGVPPESKRSAPNRAAEIVNGSGGGPADPTRLTATSSACR